MFYKNDKENIFICGDILKGMKTELLSCAECNKPIYDRFFLNVGGYSWHGKCLKCCRCSLAFDQQQKCYLRDRQVYCKNDYIKEFCMKCSKCDIYIAPSDWVRRARNLVFHLACFSCESCSRQLGTGDQFALLDDRVLCKEHYLDTMDCGTTDSDDNVDGDGYHKSKAKRVRTTFTEDQLQVLQANFQIDSNPDGQDLERIASVTGLTKRVTQVWFQNSRARQKKHIHAVPRENDGNPYSRHINLQLNYTFQSNNTHMTNGINNNNNNNINNNNNNNNHNNNNNNNNNINNHNHNNSNSKSSMYTHESSLDELSQDSNSMHCMQAEV